MNMKIFYQNLKMFGMNLILFVQNIVEGKIDRNEYMKQKQVFDKFQQQYNSVVA